jgi:hypothetical protein
MRSIILLLLTILFNHSFAECSWGELYVYPKSNIIEENSWIILEGYASSQTVIDSLNKNYRVYLESEGTEISMRIQYINKGGFRLSQAILKPETKLIIGRTYTIKLENLKGDKKTPLQRYNYDDKKYEAISWIVSRAKKNQTPRFNTTPKLINQEYLRYGCGPAINTIFELNINQEIDLLIRTELVEIETKITTTYFLNYYQNDTLKIGHDMCSGAFNYKPEKSYKIRFCIYSLNGNSNHQWSDWITFKSPYEQYWPKN